MDNTDYKEYLNSYLLDIKKKIIDLNKRFVEITSDMRELNTIIQNGVIPNCLNRLENKVGKSKTLYKDI